MAGSESPKFITTCETDDEGNLAIVFPDELLEALGWKEGTTLDIDIIADRLIFREVVADGGNQADE